MSGPGLSLTPDAGHSDFIIYVDESGDHSLDSIDPDYPVFVLSFCVFRKSDYVYRVTPAIRDLKFRTFGHDMVVLHESDIRRKKGAFSRLGREPREEFLNNLTDIIAKADFRLVAVVIDKHRLKDRYARPTHPYHLALEFGLERIYRLLRSAQQDGSLSYVVCEARGAREDTELELAFRRIRDGENPSPESRRAPVVPGAQRRPRSRNPFASDYSGRQETIQEMAAPAARSTNQRLGGEGNRQRRCTRRSISRTTSAPTWP